MTVGLVLGLSMALLSVLEIVGPSLAQRIGFGMSAQGSV